MTTAGGLALPDDRENLAPPRCGKPVEECTTCKWRSGNRPERPCVKCGGPVIQRPCRAWPVIGTEACVAHGSGNQRAKKAGRRRIAQGRAAKSLRDVEVVPIGDPLEELADLASEARSLQRFFADKVGDAGDRGDTVEGAAVLKLYTDALHETGKLLERCARLGIEGKRTDAMVAQGQQIARVIQGSIEAAFAAVLALASGGTVDVAAVIDVQHTQVPAIVRRQISEASGQMEGD
jgi:hypothetical protein